MAVTNNELRILQGLPLDLKIMKTKIRIEEWIRYYGADGCYVSFSGGKDSTVLHHLVKEVEMQMFGEIKIPRVFSDTGLEYPELKESVNELKKEIGDLMVILRPTKSFLQVVNEYGYPVISKVNSRMISDLQNVTWRNKTSRDLYITGINGKGQKSPCKLPKKWHYLQNADFKANHRCCYYMKKAPFYNYEKLTDRKPFVGVMATESHMRMKSYLQHGCNAFNMSKAQSRPMGFWTEQDVLEYIKTNNIKIPSVYGDIIVNENGEYVTTGVRRTGCVFCAFGVHLEPSPNRFEQMKETHPKLYDYCIKGGEYVREECYKEVKSINSNKVMYYKTNRLVWKPKNGLGMGHVLDILNVKY